VTAFWDTVPCSFIEEDVTFPIALMVEAVGTAETPVIFILAAVTT
jgi:hypothetical protein